MRTPKKVALRRETKPDTTSRAVRKINVFKPLGHWYFVRAALANCDAFYSRPNTAGSRVKPCSSPPPPPQGHRFSQYAAPTPATQRPPPPARPEKNGEATQCFTVIDSRNPARPRRHRHSHRTPSAKGSRGPPRAPGNDPGPVCGRGHYSQPQRHRETGTERGEPRTGRGRGPHAGSARAGGRPGGDTGAAPRPRKLQTEPAPLQGHDRLFCAPEPERGAGAGYLPHPPTALPRPSRCPELRRRRRVHALPGSRAPGLLPGPLHRAGPARPREAGLRPRRPPYPGRPLRAPPPPLHLP